VSTAGRSTTNSMSIGHWHSRQLVLWGCPVPGWHQGAVRCTDELQGAHLTEYHQNCPFCGAQFPSKCQPRYGRRCQTEQSGSKALRSSVISDWAPRSENGIEQIEAGVPGTGNSGSPPLPAAFRGAGRTRRRAAGALPPPRGGRRPDVIPPGQLNCKQTNFTF
jgi:hypothetical protein